MAKPKQYGSTELLAKAMRHVFSEVDRVRPPGCAGPQTLHTGEIADLVTHFLRCGNDGVVKLLQGRTAALDRRLSRRA